MIFRIDVFSSVAAHSFDPLGQAVRQQVKELGSDPGSIHTTRIFLIDTDATREQMWQVAGELLADPVVEAAEVWSTSTLQPAGSRIEIHLKPGVMDPVATSTEMAIRDMGLAVREVRTGRAFHFERSLPREQLQQIANRVLANGVIESVHFEPFVPQQFQAGREYLLNLRQVALRELNDAQLKSLSRESHLFLSLPEMKAIQSYFREQGREPTDIEIETIAQTWSEHCVHKTLKSAVQIEVQDEAGKTIGQRSYKNLIRETIFASTMELMSRTKDGQPPFCLSVFKDNAGVVAFDDADAICFKVETHNHPSAIEPYGGSATGIGGVIRDILGTGLGAKPVANSDVFCVADPNWGRKDALLPATSIESANPSSASESALPRGIIHPKRILQQIVAGVRDYGNRMGIPTVNGGVYFDNRYLGNPLVFCGCVGLIPRNMIEKQSRRGDAIVVMGGRTGRDGIHGATFSSAELTDTHADEFSHAVQIGNAITEKKVTDVILVARDRRLFTAVTDCGAGGLSSAVGEMGEKIGAQVELDRVPLKYAGLRHDEIWISEAQERMVLSVPQDKVKQLLELAAGEDVEATVIGIFGTPGEELILRYRDSEVGRLAMHFLHDGIPMPTRKAVVTEGSIAGPTYSVTPALGDISTRLLKALSHPNIASKHWIIRQYDHEVQGGSVIKPLTGPLHRGPSDAAVIRPKLGSTRAVAIGCGMTPFVADPYAMAVASIDEAIRNVICVGCDYNQIAILDNFCWPSVDDERTMGTLVRACEACRDAALALGIPFISGKDSLHNQFTNQETGEVLRIPNTLLISAIGIVEDVRRCITMDLKNPGDAVVLVRVKNPADLKQLAQVHCGVAGCIEAGLVKAAHDVSDGGVLVAAAEMALAAGLGLRFNDSPAGQLDYFAEQPGGYLLEVASGEMDRLRASLESSADVIELAVVQVEPKLERRAGDETFEIAVEELSRAWRGTLEW